MGRMGGKEGPAVEPQKNVIADPVIEMEDLQPEPVREEEAQEPKAF